MSNISPDSSSRSLMTRIGIVGTGFIAVGLCMLLRMQPDLAVSRMLTRRPVDSISGVEPNLLTNSIQELVANSDIIVECSGDILHATEVVGQAFQAGLPVVTMAAEFHVTVGSYFADRGRITEGEGDQPGSLAALREEALSMGFNPLVYGNIKGFLNREPEREEMLKWSKRNGISLSQVTSFTDGTKLQIEQALVANGLGGTVAQRGLLGPEGLELDAAGNFLGAAARQIGRPIADYVRNGKLPAGVFLTAEHPTERPDVLRYLKLGEGPYYTLLRPYHLCHLELPRTIRRMVAGGTPLLNNSASPTVGVIAVAKRDLPAGYVIETAVGGFDLRGEAALLHEVGDAPPIGLLSKAVLRHSLAKGQVVQLTDVDIPDSLAKTAWQALHARTSSVAVPDGARVLAS